MKRILARRRAKHPMEYMGFRAVTTTPAHYRREAWAGLTAAQARDWLHGMADADDTDYPVDARSVAAFMAGVKRGLRRRNKARYHASQQGCKYSSERSPKDNPRKRNPRRRNPRATTLRMTIPSALESELDIQSEVTEPDATSGDPWAVLLAHRKGNKIVVPAVGSQTSRHLEDAILSLGNDFDNALEGRLYSHGEGRVIANINRTLTTMYVKVSKHNWRR